MRVSSTDFQNAVGKYLTLAQKETITITKNGKSVAKLTATSDPQEFIINEAKGNYNVRRHVSYEEYEKIVGNSEKRFELINGEIYLLASPSFRHQIIVFELAKHLDSHLHGRPCRTLTAPFDVRLFGYATKFSENPNVVQPDVVVICDLENITEGGKYEGIPELLVEVLSPSTKGKDLITKLDLYQRSGVREYWIVDPDKNILSQYAFTEERELLSNEFYRETDILESIIFTEFTLELSRIFKN